MDELAKENPQKLEYELPPKMLVLTFAMCLRGETAHDAGSRCWGSTDTAAR